MIKCSIFPVILIMLGLVSSLGCLDTPVVLPTRRLGARAEVLLKLTNQKPGRIILREGKQEAN